MWSKLISTFNGQIKIFFSYIVFKGGLLKHECWIGSFFFFLKKHSQIKKCFIQHKKEEDKNGGHGDKKRWENKRVSRKGEWKMDKSIS